MKLCVTCTIHAHGTRQDSYLNSLCGLIFTHTSLHRDLISSVLICSLFIKTFTFFMTGFRKHFNNGRGNTEVNPKNGKKHCKSGPYVLCAIIVIRSLSHLLIENMISLQTWHCYEIQHNQCFWHH